MKKNYSIIVASGIGSRSGLSEPKQFYKLGSQTILEHSISVFEAHPHIDGIIIVIHPDYIQATQQMIQHNRFLKITAIVAGGKTRQESVYHGLCAIKEQDTNVLIHDAVRPFISPRIITDCIQALQTHKAIAVALDTYDTLIQVEDHYIQNIPAREKFKRAQTPQCFDLQLIQQVHQKAILEGNTSFTDDCSLVLHYSNNTIFLVQGDDINFKITSPLDIALADTIYSFYHNILPKSHLSSLAHKVIIIFGSALGLGKNIAELAESYGAIVYRFAKSEGLDITDFQEVQQVMQDIFKQEGKIDSIIIMAGVFKKAPLNQRTMEDISQEIAINYLAPLHIAKASFEYLKQSQGALILFGSQLTTRGKENYSTYSSVKMAINTFTQAIAKEWSEYQIRVNAIVPEPLEIATDSSSFYNEDKAIIAPFSMVAQNILELILADITGRIIHIH